MRAAQKTTISFAIAFMSGLASGVGSASVAVLDLTASRTAPVPQHVAIFQTGRYARFQESVHHMNHKARRLAQLFEAECHRLARLEPGEEVDHEPYSGLVLALRQCEAQTQDMLDHVDEAFAQESGLMELRRSLAKVRANARNAEHMAWQTTATPTTVDAESSGEALAALAGHMSDHMADRLG